ncbi:amidase [Thauera butanivorans]|uniref:amidase n=1 Tax=Thauera butanivorans TaxID=86174 RepID=UPI0008394127|nr:amidase [Thauera butanivorans]
MSGELHYREISELAPLIRERRLSPVELTEAMLARIDTLDSQLHAYARVTAEQARAESRAAEEQIMRGEYRGPLHGIPLAVKDLFWTKGVTTSAGTTVHADFMPSEDATVVRRLRKAGAIILGKLQLTEGAFAVPHPSIAPPINPWGASRWCGASSSGSGVATAAGLCFGSLGSDTGGSIRFPCAANGLTGLKPTWGRVSRHGAFELAALLDHVGPMARSAADARLLFDAIEGHDPLDPTSLPGRAPAMPAEASLKHMRIGIDPAWNANGSDADTLCAVEDALAGLRDLGAHVTEIRFPDARDIAGNWEAQCGVQTAVAHAATYPARAAEYGPALSRLIDIGRALDGMAYQRLLLAAAAFTGKLTALLETIDLLLVPVQPLAAPTHEQLGALAADPEANQRLIQYTAPFDISGHPALSLPSTPTANGLPVGIQLVARKGGERLLLAAGAALQQATAWHKNHP